MTRMPLRVNAAAISSEAPASVTSTSTSSMGHIMAGPCVGGARRQTDGFVFLNQFSSGYSDVPLVFHEAMLAGLERRVVAKRFIEQLLPQGRAAVGAPDQSSGLQARQVPA